MGKSEYGIEAVINDAKMATLAGQLPHTPLTMRGNALR